MTLLRWAAGLFFALLLWVLLGFAATMPLGAIFGWSGHPAMPAAPLPVYVVLYLILLPTLCLVAAWRLTGWIEGRFGGGTRKARHSIANR